MQENYLNEKEIRAIVDEAIANHEKRFIAHGIVATALISAIAFTLDGIARII